MRVPVRGLVILAVALLGAGTLGALSAGAATGDAGPKLLSRNHPTTASSAAKGHPAKNAVDGKSGTRWASAPGDGPQWIAVDLSGDASLARIRLDWDVSCAKAYELQTSPDGKAWHTILSRTAAKGGVENLPVTGSGRFVRALLTHRCRTAANAGYSLRELQVFGTPVVEVPPGPPTNVRIGDVVCGAVEISWDPPANFVPVAYDIFGDGQLLKTVPGNVTHTVLTGLLPNRTYGISITARDAAGDVTPPSETRIVVSPPCDDPTPPSTPTNVHIASVTGHCVTVVWNPSTDNVLVIGYNVYLDGQLYAFVTTPTITFCDLVPNVRHTVQVTALDENRNESAKSQPLLITVPPPCETAPICRIDPVTTSTHVPWGLVTLPDGSILFTERDSADLVHATTTGVRAVVGHVPNVAHTGTGDDTGLLGLEISRTFSTDHWLYFFHSSPTDNRIVRIRYENGALNLASEQVLVKGIARSRSHDGGRLRFGPDGKLYAGTGDGQIGADAQNPRSLNGKILRLNPDGSVPPDNPFGNYVWSYGFHDVKGLAFDSQGRLWAAEPGETRQDELDLVVKGGNYGWPACEGTVGDCANPAFIAPVRTFAPQVATPGGIAIVNNVIYLAATRGARLYRMVITGSTTAPPTILLPGVYGRLRTVEPTPAAGLWLTTTNGDGPDRTPVDRVLRITLA
jgi:glucose/arabinose dehydrogenase